MKFSFFSPKTKRTFEFVRKKFPPICLFIHHRKIYYSCTLGKEHADAGKEHFGGKNIKITNYETGNLPLNLLNS